MANALGITLPVGIGANGYFATTTDVLTQVKTDITNLLLTVKGERVMQPTFGCDLPLVVFNNQTDDGLAEIQTAIQQSVQTWIPFVQVTAVQVTQDPNNQRVFVAVAFKLLTGNNIIDTITIAF